MQDQHELSTKIEGRDDESGEWRKKHTEISNPGMSLCKFVSSTKNRCNFDERGRHHLTVNDGLSQAPGTPGTPSTPGTPGTLRPDDPPGLRLGRRPRLSSGRRPRLSCGGRHSDNEMNEDAERRGNKKLYLYEKEKDSLFLDYSYSKTYFFSMHFR